MMEKLFYEQSPEFQRDLKRLLKRFSTLEEDLETAKTNAIELYHLHGVNNQSVFEIPQFCRNELQICKLKKFACKSLRGTGIKSGIRIIYAYFPEGNKVIFLEIYYKGDKENEDRERIKRFFMVE
jgi:mRNA-degrading endonuclease YafQ of YafQ-DinJ toxin-antitoxin module